MATLFSGFLPVPYYPTASGAGAFDGLLAVGVILAVAAAITAALVLLNRPVQQPAAKQIPTGRPGELQKAA